MKTPEELAEEYGRSEWPIVSNDCNRIGRDSSIEGFLAGYQAAAPQWISVKDRLPEEDTTVIAFVNYSVDDAKLQRTGSAAYRGKLWLMGSDIYSERFVTHWMPLPKPPEE